MIHLGYEIPSGRAVSIPLRHTAITGQTQEAGKTTALEALIARGPMGVRALTFITKRGERAFQYGKVCVPHFRERADWQYVSAILEATLREKLKFERSWIMQVCKGAQTLADVQRNIENRLEKARGLNESVLTTLHAYLEIVLPQISQTAFAPSVNLVPGVNIMDLSGFQLEMQMLIIRSAIEWVYEREENTIVIIPEAWEFIPQQRGSPVKLAVEQLIRKGASLKNYVWLDSQDIAGVHKDILRQVQVWILGVQREKNEVARTLAHVPAGVGKPAISDLMQLGLGEFYTCFGSQVIKTYVQPVWVTDAQANGHAVGGLPVPGDPRFGRNLKPKEDDAMWKEKYEALKARYDKLEQDLAELRDASRRTLIVKGGGTGDGVEGTAVTSLVPGQNGADQSRASAAERGDTSAYESMYAYVKSRLLHEADPGILALLSRRPEIHLKIERPVMDADDSSLRGKLARLILEGFFDEAATGNSAFLELKRRGASVAKPSVYREMDKLAELGFVTIEKGEGYKKVAGTVIKRA